MLRKILIWLGKVCAAGVITIILLSLFAFGYNYTAVHIYNPDGATDFTFPPHQRYNVMTEGYAWTRLDEHGFNNPDGSGQGQIDNLLMGSSQMFGVYVPREQSVGSLLNDLLPEQHTYNIGMGEHGFHTCINNIGAAMNTYHPASSIILETNMVNLSVVDMESVVDASYPDIISYDSGILYMLQRYVPAVKIFYRQLDDWYLMASPSDDRPENNDYNTSQQYQSLLDTYFASAAEKISRGGGTSDHILSSFC